MHTTLAKGSTKRLDGYHGSMQNPWYCGKLSQCFTYEPTSRDFVAGDLVARLYSKLRGFDVRYFAETWPSPI